LLTPLGKQGDVGKHNVANQLTRQLVNGGDPVFDYNYDRNGNLIRETKNGSIVTNYTFDYENRLTGKKRRYPVYPHILFTDKHHGQYLLLPDQRLQSKLVFRPGR